MVDALVNLLDFYVPAIFLLGCEVRRLTWEGGVGGAVTGAHARQLMQNCLAVQLHLTEDFRAAAEYTRTLSVALLGWQEWYGNLPGCCFVEESCEALLSRMAARCDANRHVTSYDDMFALFVTLPPPQSEAQPTGGGVSQSLVYLMISRIRRFLRGPTAWPFPQQQGVRRAVWVADYPAGMHFPVQPSEDTSGFSMQGVLAKTLLTLTAPVQAPAAVRTVARSLIPARTNGAELAALQEAHRRIRLSAGQAPISLARILQEDAGAPVPSVEEDISPPQPAPTQDQATSTTDLAQAAPSQPVAVESQAIVGRDVDSEGGSLYNPPELDDRGSESGHSFGDTDSLGSLGDLQYGHGGNWSTLETDGPVDPSVDHLQEWYGTPPAMCCWTAVWCLHWSHVFSIKCYVLGPYFLILK